MKHTLPFSQLFASLGTVLILTLAHVGVAQAREGVSESPQQEMPAASPTTQAEPPGQLSVAQSPLCRYGVSAIGAAQLSWLPTWRTGWTLDFTAHPPSPLLGATEFAQVISAKQNRTCFTYHDSYSVSPSLTEQGLGALLKAAPGALWLVGNEPDRGPNEDAGNCNRGAQDATQPEMYARIYHDVYTFIKQHDPNARVANAALVQITPGRLQYLDKVWEEYQRRYGAPMPVDVWNSHLYVLPEVRPDGQPNGIANVAVGTDPSLGMRESGGDPARCSDPQVYCFAEHDDIGIFAQQVTAMRTWMKNHGQQNKPLIISEFSLLYPYDLDPDGCFVQDEFGKCFTPERVSDFMKRSYSYLEEAIDPALGYPLDGNRMVQRWMWFPVYFGGAGRASSLVTDVLTEQTMIGRTLETEVATTAATVNLLSGRVNGSAAPANDPGATVTATLSVQVYNSGLAANTTPLEVTFYSDSALTQAIGTAVVTAPINGCVIQSQQASVLWTDLPLGVHRFWVRVDSADAVWEITEEDNYSTGVVYAYAHAAHLPMVSR